MKLTQKKLKRLLRYEPCLGVFWWRVDKGARAKAGAVAGSISKSTGYWEIGIDGRVYLAHRLAFLYMLGRWPKGETDHRNQKRTDNRWRNLRDATRSQNLRNTGPRRLNATKEKHITGTRKSMYRVIMKNAQGKNVCLGSFHELRNAILVRDSFLPIYYPEF